MPGTQVQLRGRIEVSASPLTGEARRLRLLRLRGHLEDILRRAAANGVYLTPEQARQLHGREAGEDK